MKGDAIFGISLASVASLPFVLGLRFRLLRRRLFFSSDRLDTNAMSSSTNIRDRAVDQSVIIDGAPTGRSLAANVVLHRCHNRLDEHLLIIDVALSIRTLATV